MKIVHLSWLEKSDDIIKIHTLKTWSFNEKYDVAESLNFSNEEVSTSSKRKPLLKKFKSNQKNQQLTICSVHENVLVERSVIWHNIRRW